MGELWPTLSTFAQVTVLPPWWRLQVRPLHTCSLQSIVTGSCPVTSSVYQFKVPVMLPPWVLSFKADKVCVSIQRLRQVIHAAVRLCKVSQLMRVYKLVQLNLHTQRLCSKNNGPQTKPWAWCSFVKKLFSYGCSKGKNLIKRPSWARTTWKYNKRYERGKYNNNILIY